MVALLLTAFTYVSSAQIYQTAVGIRGGFSNGITGKHFISDHSALEGILSLRNNGWMVTALYQEYNPAFDVNNLYWYYGGGAHVGYWQKYQSNHFGLGIDAIIGLEYVFNPIPLNVSLDYKPMFNLYNLPRFMADEVAISIRYTFGN